MKKILSLFLVLALALTVVACGGRKDQAAVDEAKLVLSAPTGVLKQFSLDTKVGDVEVTWTSSSNQLVVGTPAAGKVNVNVVRAASDTTVKLTATLQFNDAKGTKEFDVLVYGNPNLADTIAPEIQGASDFGVFLGDPAPNWLEGVVAYDNLEGLVAVTVDASGVNLTKKGTYDLTYVAKDAAGNEATVVVKVQVIDEKVIINGTKNHTVYIGDAAPDFLAGVTAVDKDGKDAAVVVDSSALDVTKEGTYDVVYTFTNLANDVVVRTVKVNVVKDTVAPVILGRTVVQFFIGQAALTEEEWLEGYTVTDNRVAASELEIEVDFTDADFSVKGTFDVTYTSEDKDGNIGTLVVLVQVLDEHEENARAFAAGIDLPTRTHSNVTLPAGDAVYTVTWASSNHGAMSDAGVVTRAAKDAGVKLTATVVNAATTTQVIRDFWLIVTGTEINVDGAYTASFSEIETLNPLTSTGASDSDVYTYLMGTLFRGDYDWVEAIEEGYATYAGDFSNIRSDRNETGTVEMPSLRYTNVLSDASRFPVSSKTNTDFSDGLGRIDIDASKAALDSEWTIHIREDLQWENGDPITVDTFEFTYRQYLDPLQNNERANYLYDQDYIPLVNGHGYYLQGKDNGSGGKHPDVAWSEVGFKKIDDYTFKLNLTTEITQWELISYLDIVNLVHPERFESGLNAAGTITTYGSFANMPLSYGPYTLNYEDGVKFTFTRNEDYHDKDIYTMKTINGPIITKQEDIINEFKAGNLDVAGVGGAFWDEFKENANLYVAPSNSFYRLAISTDRSGGTSGRPAAPILAYPEFRRALYLATDRQDFADNIQPPSQPALGFLSNIHQVNEDATEAYAASTTFRNQLEVLELSPGTQGYNLEEAQDIFAAVYAQAVADGHYTQGEKAIIQFSYYDAGSNPRIANWVKTQFEKVFGTELFGVELVPVGNNTVFSAQRNAGDFDLTFTGMNGATFQATFGMAYIFGGPEFSTFLVGKGYDIAGAEVVADLGNLYGVITQIPETDWTESQLNFIDSVDNAGVFEGTFRDLYELFGVTADFSVNYEGVQEDLTNMTAAFEKVILEQMVAVPLFSSTSAAVYSNKVLRQQHAYHLFLGWGGLAYMHIKA